MIISVVDTTGIQPYVFGSNRLGENIGASHLVATATTDWSAEAAHDASGGSAELLYAGGGNFAVRFTDVGHADAFERKLSRDALCRAPGLQLVIAHVEYDPIHDCLAKKIDNAFKELERLKRERERSAPLLSRSVTRACRSTGLPAVGWREEPNQTHTAIEASADTLAKDDAISDANLRLVEYFSLDSTPAAGCVYPRDLDDLGRTLGDQSYIAVVHADGNGMGRKIQEIGKTNSNPDGDGTYIEANKRYAEQILAFSNGVNAAGSAALRRTLNDLAHVVTLEGQRPDGSPIYAIMHGERIRLDLTVKTRWMKNGKQKVEVHMPFRPLIYGGDDVTFVCDGRLGIALASRYLEYFEAETEAHPAIVGRLTGCAGVAIVKSHYPFSRAYALAEALCRCAKGYRKADPIKCLNEIDGSCLDWHFALSGMLDPLDQIRDREYIANNGGVLHQRPVTLGDNPRHQSPYSAWPRIESALTILQGENWSGRRNKMKELREALRAGHLAMEKFTALYELKDDPLLSNGSAFGKHGWDNLQCTLFDATELADIYIPLPKHEAKP